MLLAGSRRTMSVGVKHAEPEWVFHKQKCRGTIHKTASAAYLGVVLRKQV